MTRRGNGFGSLIDRGNGKPFLARWVHKGVVYYKTTGQTDKKKALKELERITRPFRDAREEDAIRNLQNRIIELQEGRTKTSLLTLDIWDEFSKKLKNDDVETATTKLYEGIVKHMSEWMNHKTEYAKGITTKLAEQYLDYLSNTVGVTTYNIRLVLFKRIWKSLADEFQLSADVWEKFKKKKGAKTTRRTLSNDELTLILKNANTQDIKTLLLTGIYTGLRLSDCANLKWEDIDFEKNIIKVVPIKTRKHMDTAIEIPIHKTLRKVLEDTPRTSEYVSLENANDYKHGTLVRQIIALFKKCGIETSKKVNGKTQLICGFHSLRHTFVSMAINSGMSPLLVQKIVGHSAVNMTEHYYHENVDKAAEGISQMPEFLQVS